MMRSTSDLISRGIKAKVARRSRFPVDPSTRSLHSVLESNPALPDLQPGLIYDCYASLKNILSEEGPFGPAQFHSPLPMSGFGSSSFSSGSRPSSKNPRPILVTDIDIDGQPRLVALSTVEEFQPLFLCCDMQHYLVSINDTPAWPSAESFRLQIRPWWPRVLDQSTQHYALAKPVLARNYDVRDPCTYVDDKGVMRHYSVANEVRAEFLRLCNAMRAKYFGLSPKTQVLYKLSFAVGQTFYSRVKVLHQEAKEAKRRFTASEILELDELFNANLKATHDALGRPHPGWVSITANHLPKFYRSSFPDASTIEMSLPTYTDRFPDIQTSPTSSANHFVLLLPFIMGLQSKAPHDDEVLAEMLSEVVKTIKAAELTINGAFAHLHQSKAVACVQKDPALANALRALCDAKANGLAGTVDDVRRLRNYICHSP